MLNTAISITIIVELVIGEQFMGTNKVTHRDILITSVMEI